MENGDENRIWKLIWISGAILLLELGLLVFAIIRYEPPKKLRYTTTDKKNVNITVTNKTISEKLVSVSELSTYQHEYHGEVNMKADKDWVVFNFLTESEITIEYEGIIKAGVKVDQILIEVNQDEKIIFLTMPTPEILSNEISIVNYEEDVSWFGEVSGSDGNDLLEQAKEEERDKAIKGGLLKNADQKAKQTVRDLLSVYENEYQIVFVETEMGRK